MNVYVNFVTHRLSKMKDIPCLINCELYSDIRLPLFQKAGEHNENFNTLIAEDKLIFIMQNKDLQFLLGSTLSKMFARRKTFS